MNTVPQKKNTGFTLVETLVAVSILSLSILATFTAVQNGLHSSSVSRDEVTAFYLTQEAIEYIKNIRDENALNAISGGSATWLTGLSEVSGDPCYFGKVCMIDAPLKNVMNCGSAAVTSSPPNLCPVLRQDVLTGLLGYTPSWAATKFKREIQFVSVNSDEVRVVVSISWTDKNQTKSFQVNESLFNRQ